MSFKGIVTRKQENTGVTLRAKIVTDNKKKSVKKDYKITILANDISDREACMRDLVNTQERLYSQNIGNLDGTTNLRLNTMGQYGTNILYEIINDGNFSNVSKYLNPNTGVINGRPLFGEKDASGAIKITVSKNEEKVTGLVNIVIKAYTAKEVLNSPKVSKDALWSKIAGSQQQYYLNNNTIDLVSTWSPWNALEPLSNTPITIEWTIDDKLLTGVSGILTEKRVSVGNKQVITPAYSLLSAAYNDKTAENAQITISEGDKNNSSTYARKLKVNGLNISAVLSIGEETKQIVFENIYTNSALLTNAEVMTAIKANTDTLSGGAKESKDFRVFNASDNSDIGGYIVEGTASSAISGPTVTKINANTISDGQYTIKAINGGSLETIYIPSLLLNSNKSLAGVITVPEDTGNIIYAFNGQKAYTDSHDNNVINDVFSIATNTTNTLITININKMKDFVDGGESQLNTFLVKQILNITAYAGDAIQTEIWRQFVVQNLS